MFDFTINKRLSICLVDANPKTRSQLGDLLKSMGAYIPIFCSNFQEAIEEYKNYTLMGPPDFIISEWSKQFFDPAFLSFLNNSPLADIPIIMFSGNIRDNPWPVPKQMKIIDSLRWPIRRQMLRTVINSYLEIIMNDNDGSK